MQGWNVYRRQAIQTDGGTKLPYNLGLYYAVLDYYIGHNLAEDHHHEWQTWHQTGLHTSYRSFLLIISISKNWYRPISTVHVIRTAHRINNFAIRSAAHYRRSNKKECNENISKNLGFSSTYVYVYLLNIYMPAVQIVVLQKCQCVFVLFVSSIHYLACMMSLVVECDVTFRAERSLGLLTTRFVSLLQNLNDGILDLNIVVLTSCHEYADCGPCTPVYTARAQEVGESVLCTPIIIHILFRRLNFRCRVLVGSLELLVNMVACCTVVVFWNLGLLLLFHRGCTWLLCLCSAVYRSCFCFFVSKSVRNWITIKHIEMT